MPLRLLYFSRDDIEGMVPAAFILQALDDDGDGVEDAGMWDTVSKNACDEADAACSSMFTVPFAEPVPVLVAQTAQSIMAASLYRRRAIEDAKNPYAKEAAEKTSKLTRICQKEESVPKDFPVAVNSVSAITERAKTSSTGGFLCA